MIAPESLWIWGVAALVLLAALALLRRPLWGFIRLLLRSCGGLALLALLQQVGGVAGVMLGVNWLNALVLGLLGIPGFGLLMLLQWALRS